MRPPACLGVIALLSLAPLLAQATGTEAPSPLFPLPTLDGKPLAAAEGQKLFRVPMRMARVEQFYRERFGKEPQVTMTVTMPQGRRTLTIISRRKGDHWTKAVIRQGEVETVIEITPVLRLAGEEVTGTGRPLVEFIFTRSEEARKMSEQIDHMEDLRR